MALLIAVVAALSASTIWPLYRSIFEPPVIDTRDIPTNFHTFTGLLSLPQGIEAFKQFLSKEFSVENLLFFLEGEATLPVSLCFSRPVSLELISCALLSASLTVVSCCVCAVEELRRLIKELVSDPDGDQKLIQR